MRYLVMKESPSTSTGAAATVGVQHQDLVLVDFVGRVKASPSSSSDNDNDSDSGDRPIFHQASNVWIVLGDKDVLPVVKMGIRYCSVGGTLVQPQGQQSSTGTAHRQRSLVSF